jgi:hypothetical protein
VNRLSLDFDSCLVSLDSIQRSHSIGLGIRTRKERLAQSQQLAVTAPTTTARMPIFRIITGNGGGSSNTTNLTNTNNTPAAQNSNNVNTTGLAPRQGGGVGGGPGQSFPGPVVRQGASNFIVNPALQPPQAQLQLQQLQQQQQLQLQQQQLLQQQQQQQQQRASRHTYPGHRLAATPPQPQPVPTHQQQMAGLPSHMQFTAQQQQNMMAGAPNMAAPQQPRVGGSMARGAANMVLQQQQQQFQSAQQQQQVPHHATQANSNVVLPGSHVPQQQQQQYPQNNSNIAMLNPTPMAPTPPTTAPSSGGAGGPAASVETTRPGAYAVTRSMNGPAQVYRVTVPPGVRPGSEFTVHAGPRRVRVRCPPTSRPGHSLQITLPPEPVQHNHLLKMAPLTSVDGERTGGGAVLMTPEVRKVNQAASESGGTAQTFLVTIPPNIYPGMQFTVNVNGQRFMVTCPSNAGPNMKVRIVPPTQREEPMAAPKTQVFEVSVPEGVRPNQPFTLMANGQRVLVTCPPNVVPGQKIRFQLPVQQVIGSIQLSYEGESGGWCRTIRVNDLKFQWVRVNKNDNSSNDSKKGPEDGKRDSATAVDVDGMERFDFSKSAYVRKINYMEGNDARMRTGSVELVPANEAAVDSRLVFHNRTLLSYADIATVQGKPLEEKTLWFQNICKQLTADWNDGHIKLVIRRHQMLNDSVDSVMSLGREDLRKPWRIEFFGEPAIDAGGVTREWFQLVSEQLFDPDMGLWLSSVNNQMCMTINPACRKYTCSFGFGVPKYCGFDD